jgi:release factor glutamine methyltransferase
MNNILNELTEKYINKYNIDSLDITSNPRELVVLLLSEIKSVKMADIKLNMVDITDADVQELDQMIEKIAVDKIPPQYLTHKAYIYNEEYYIEPGVLIPRQDTETLIEESINCIKENGYLSLLDVCTGTGCVGISIMKNSNIENSTLIDISDIAIKVANKNIELNGVDGKCEIIKSDMFSELYKTTNKYDIITSNPPYLTDEEMEEISDFVKNEPELALRGGKDGLKPYRVIFNEAKNFLNDGGSILVEIGYREGEDVVNIIKEHEEYTDIQVIKDINSKDRVVKCRFQKK